MKVFENNSRPGDVVSLDKQICDMEAITVLKYLNESWSCFVSVLEEAISNKEKL